MRPRESIHAYTPHHKLAQADSQPNSRVIGASEAGLDSLSVQRQHGARAPRGLPAIGIGALAPAHLSLPEIGPAPTVQSSEIAPPTVSSANLPSAMRRWRLINWAQQLDISADERVERQYVVTRILAASSVQQVRSRTQRDASPNSVDELAPVSGDFSVHGSLYFSRRASLTQLPQGLSVGGDLDLSGCAELRRLPENLRVGGSLTLSGCANLIELPTNLCVEGALHIEDSARLTQLPEGLRVGGNLTCQRCPALHQLPDSIEVGGHLSIRHCSALTHLPDLFQVAHNLDLADCNNLIELPPGLAVGGKLTLSGCTSLVALSTSLATGGPLNLANCTSLALLPAGLNVQGGINLSGCSSLTHWPQDAVFDGDLNLENCTSLSQLPAGLSVAGNLHLIRCTGLSHLPAGLRVGGTLHLFGCTNISHLPDGLIVGEDLELATCSELRRLPENLAVGGALNLAHCSALRQLPASLNIGGDLNLYACANLTSLTPAIITWGPRSDGHTRIVNLTLSGLSENVVGRLLAARADGMHFVFDHVFAEPTDAGRLDLDGAVAFWQNQSIEQKSVCLDLWRLDNEDSSVLLQFLSRLRYTADYRSVIVRPHLVARVCSFLQAIDRNASLRSEVLECISTALSSCNDRVIWAMNQIELAVRVSTAERDGLDDRQLIQLILGFMKLDIVHAHARKKIAGALFADEVEIFLAYEVGLRDALQLPVNTQDMLYGSCAGVTGKDLEDAKQAALNAMRDHAFVRNYFAASALWQRHKRTLKAQKWSWAALEPRRLPAELQLVHSRCPLTLEKFGELSEPLVWQQARSCVVYEAADFIKHWVAHGFEPTTRQSIDLDALVRPRITV